MRHNFPRHWVGMFALSVFLMSGNAFAFELSTHGAITGKSFGTVIARNPDLLQRLGITDSTNAFGDTYFILVGQNPVERTADPDFEGVRIVKLEVEPLSVPGWLMRGAMREDDDSANYEPNPKVDPEGDFHRVLRHWFDPTASGSGALSQVGGFVDPCTALEPNVPPGRCVSALDWALGTLNAKQSTNAEDTARRNHFSVRDAREAMWRAATLLGKSGQGYVSILPAGADPATQQSTRNQYWATTFRALGDVSHLIQDMAQPQHTRNEAHSGLYGRVAQDFLTGHRSVIEQFFEASVLGQRSISVERDPNDPGKSGRDIPVTLLPTTLDGYAPPAFDSYRKFWTTRPDGELNPRGLADFSNANFFTVGNNLGNALNHYAYPSRSPQAYTRQIEAATTWDGRMVGNPAAAEGLTYLYGPVTDNYTGVTTNIAQATYGFWDEFLEQRGEPAGYTLTRKNYEAQANLLLPRAVGYTAGFLEYFFRGKLNISLPEEGVYAVVDHAVEKAKDTDGFRQIKVNVQNLSQAGTGTETLGSGSFVAVVKFHRNHCYTPGLEGQYGAPGVDWHMCRDAPEELAVSRTVTMPPNTDFNASPQPLVFDFDAVIPINATDIYMQVLFRGVMGNETDAIAIGTKDISEPTFTSFINSLDYDWVHDGTVPPVNFAPTGDTTAIREIMGFGANQPSVADSGDVLPGKFVRIALLTDAPYYPMYCSDCSPASAVFQSAVDEATADGSILVPVPYHKIRGVHLGIYSDDVRIRWNYVVVYWGEAEPMSTVHKSILESFPAIDPNPQPVAAIHFPLNGFASAARKMSGGPTSAVAIPPYRAGAAARIGGRVNQ